MERCSEHPQIIDKVEKVQVDVAQVKESTKNIDRALLQVMEELRARKLTPTVTWILGIMSGAIGSMAMYILDHMVGQ